MSKPLQNCSPAERTVVALLAVHGEALGKTRILEYLRHMGVRDARGRGFTNVTLGETLGRLRELGLATAPEGSGFICAPHIAEQALREALDNGSFDALCMAIEEIDPARRTYGGHLYMRTYPQAVARLRMAMLRGLSPQELLPWLEACYQFEVSSESHPYADAIGRPFDASLFAHLHPQVQEQAMIALLQHAVDAPATAPAVRAHAEGMMASGAGDVAHLRIALARHWLLCGRLAQAEELAGDDITMQVRAVAACLRSDIDAALPAFDTTLKLMRKTVGKRNVALPGFPGVLHLLSLLRSSDPKAGKQADTLLEAARRMLCGGDVAIWRQLYPLRQVLAGTMKPEEARGYLDTSTWPLALSCTTLAGTGCIWASAGPASAAASVRAVIL